MQTWGAYQHTAIRISALSPRHTANFRRDEGSNFKAA
jgi:hypothetical protein